MNFHFDTIDGGFELSVLKPEMRVQALILSPDEQVCDTCINAEMHISPPREKTKCLQQNQPFV